MSMSPVTAITEAIESLGQLMDESYEGDELNDPSVIAWMATKQEAIDSLKLLKQWVQQK